MYSCRIVNKHFTNYGRNGEMDEEEKENGSYADAFRRIVLPKFSSYIKAALNSIGFIMDSIKAISSSVRLYLAYSSASVHGLEKF